MSKSQENEVFWSWVATGKQKKGNKISKGRLGFGLVDCWAACVDQAQKRNKEKN